MKLPVSEKLFYEAITSFNEGKIIASADLFLELAEQFPSFGKAQCYLGVIYFKFLKEPVVAEEYFKSAISSSPQFTESYIFYAELLLAQERFAEMNAHLNKVSEIPGVKKNDVYEQFGKMNELMGKYEEAIDFYKKAIKYTFSDDDMASYEKSIARCQAKKKFL